MERTYTSQNLADALNVNYDVLIKTFRENGHYYGVVGKVVAGRKYKRISWSEADLQAIRAAMEIERKGYEADPTKAAPLAPYFSKHLRQPLALTIDSIIQLSLSTTSKTIEMTWKRLADEHLRKSFSRDEINAIIDELNKFGRWKGDFEGGFVHLYLMGG